MIMTLTGKRIVMRLARRRLISSLAVSVKTCRLNDWCDYGHAHRLGSYPFYGYNPDMPIARGQSCVWHALRLAQDFDVITGDKL